MLPAILSPTTRLDHVTWFIVAATVLAGQVRAQEPIRLAAQPVTITPSFEPEGLANRFEEGAPLPAAMTTSGGGDTWVACLAYSPDGSRLAVGDRPTRPLCTFLGADPVNENGGLIRIVDLTTRRVVITIRPAKRPGHEYEIVSLAYAPDGRALVAHGKETWAKEGGGRQVGYHLTVWDAATGRVLRRIDSVKLDDWELPTFSRNASMFAARTHAEVHVWNIATGHEQPMAAGAPLEPGVLAFSPDAAVLAAGDASGEVVLWGVASGRRIARLPGRHEHGKAFNVDFLTFSPDGRSLARGDVHSDEIGPLHWDVTSRIGLIDVATNSARATIAYVDKRVFVSAAFSPDGKTIATVSFGHSGDHFDGRVSLCDAATGQEQASAGQANYAQSIAYTADGSLVVTADRKWIVLRDSANLRERVVLYQGWFTSREETVAVAPDGRTLASTNGHFKLWDLQAASVPPTTGGHRFDVTSVAYSPDVRALLSGSLDRTVKLWDVAMRRTRATLVGHGVEVVRVAYAPDGRSVASVDAAGQVLIWDPATSACRVTLKGPETSPQLLAFTPDGRTLSLTAWSHGGPAKVVRWDVATGRRLPMPNFAGGLSSPLAFSSDGRLGACAVGLRINVLSAATGELRSTITTKRETRSLLITRDGKTVFQMTPNDSIVIHRQFEGVWKAEDLFAGDPELVESGSADTGKRMTATPDGQSLAVRLDDSVRVFDTVTRRPIALLPVEAVTGFALSPDGKSLAAGRSNLDILMYGSEKAVAGVSNP